MIDLSMIDLSSILQSDKKRNYFAHSLKIASWIQFQKTITSIFYIKIHPLAYQVRSKDFPLFIDDNFDGMACKNFLSIIIVEGQFPVFIDR